MGTLSERIEAHVDAWPFNTMSTHVSREHLETYVEGFNRAKEQAKGISAEADDLMEEMAVCLEELISVAKGSIDYADQVAAKVPEMALNRYNAWKERTK